MTGIGLALHAATLLVLLATVQRVRAAQAAAAERTTVIRLLHERVTKLDAQSTTRLRDIVTQARRAAGERVPAVHFADVDATMPAAFATDTVLVLGQCVGARIATTCDGEGTCGLCVVRVTAGVEHVDPPTENERRLLGVPGQRDPRLRLACHVRPRGDMAVEGVFAAV